MERRPGPRKWNDSALGRSAWLCFGMDCLSFSIPRMGSSKHAGGRGGVMGEEFVPATVAGSQSRAVVASVATRFGVFFAKTVLMTSSSGSGFSSSMPFSMNAHAPSRRSLPSFF
jgi:hypothetical protein